MREYKFRGKMKDSGEWVYGYFYNDNMIGCNIFQTKPHLAAILVDPSTVGQYTGLKDKNGKEIYEGDICSTDLSRPYLIVVFRNGAFMYQCHDDGKDYFDIMLPTEVETDTDKYTEVIGNIHDNPELLKEVE